MAFKVQCGSFGVNSFLGVPQSNMQEGLEGNPVAGTMKNVSRGLAVLTVPFTMSFPKVISLPLVALDIFYSRNLFLYTFIGSINVASGM